MKPCIKCEIFAGSVSAVANLTNEWNSDAASYFQLCLSRGKRTHIRIQIDDYLIKQVYEHRFNNLVGNSSLDLKSNNLVSNYMWRFRRSDK